MNIPEYSLKNSKVIYFFLAVLLIGGLFAFGQLGKKEDAPFVIKTAVITTQYPGAGPQEVDRLITEPISREIQSLGDVKSIKTESYYGFSKINFELQPYLTAPEIQQKWDQLRRKVLNVQPQLPAGASVPYVNDDFGDVYGLYYALTADDGFSFAEMRDWAEKIKTQIITTEGVGKVSLFGMQTEVVNITVLMSKLAAMGIEFSTLSNLIQSQNQLINTGQINANEQELRILTNGTYTSLDDIREQIITTKNVGQVRLGDFAKVEKGYMDPPSTLMYVNGKPAIGIGVSTDPLKDVVKSGEIVEAKLKEMIPMIPIGLELVTLYPENDIARKANNGFILNLIESLIIVIVIIMLVMGFKSGVLIGSSLLFSIAGTLLLMKFMDVGLNRTSLAGFIIAMGMLVDNAIVVTDNATIAMKRGIPKRKALIDGAQSPMWNLFGATFIAICSFLPLYLSPTSTAEIVKPLFIVLALSLGLSWILALTQTPLFGSFILKEEKYKSDKDPYDTPFYNKFANFLGGLIKRRWLTIGVAAGLLILALIIMKMTPSNSFPALNKPYFKTDVFYPDGYSIHEVERDMKKVQSHLMSLPEVKNVSVTLGNSPVRYYLASASFGPKSNYANILIELTDTKFTNQYEKEFDQYMIDSFPNAMACTKLFKLSPATEAAIEIGFIGDNIDTLVHLTNQVIEIMNRYPEIIHIRNSWGNKIPVWEPVYSQQKAQPLGISRQNMAQSIQTATNGMNLGFYREDDRNMPVLLRSSTPSLFRVNDLRTIPVIGSFSNTTTLEQVVSDFTLSYKFPNYRNYNRMKCMIAQGDPKRGANTNAILDKLLKVIKKEVNIPEGYTLKYFGERESQDTNNRALMLNMPLTLILMFVTLLLLFKTYKKPVVILLMLPLIIIGVVLGLFVFGKSLDFFAILGMLGLIGMNIKNAIVLIDQIDVYMSTGIKPFNAVIGATTSRIVPVTMASGTTIFGMIPLLSDAMFGGMAATIMGGLLVATILTLLILPVTYCILFKIK